MKKVKCWWCKEIVEKTHRVLQYDFDSQYRNSKYYKCGACQLIHQIDIDRLTDKNALADAWCNSLLRPIRETKSNYEAGLITYKNSELPDDIRNDNIKSIQRVLDLCNVMLSAADQHLGG